MNTGDLVIINSNCHGIFMKNGNSMHQMNLPIEDCYDNVNIECGAIGILLKKMYASEIGTICDVIIGSDVFCDIPSEKIDLLVASTT